jgi:hypothetical protein
MILPGKHILPDRALISIGADVLSVIGAGASVSEIWRRVRELRATRNDASPLPFDWFVLALTLLCAISAVTLADDMVRPAGASP